MHESWSDARLEKVGRLIRSLVAAVRELEEEFVDEKRRFTLDGHLVGSIGEVVAAYVFGIKLYPASNKTHDGICPQGREVQIKLTGGSRIIFSGESMPDHLIVMQLKDHTFSLVYNGPSEVMWSSCTKRNNYNQRSVSVLKLRTLQADMPLAKQIPQLQKFPDLTAS